MDDWTWVEWIVPIVTALIGAGAAWLIAGKRSRDAEDERKAAARDEATKDAGAALAELEIAIGAMSVHPFAAHLDKTTWYDDYLSLRNDLFEVQKRLSLVRHTHPDEAVRTKFAELDSAAGQFANSFWAAISVSANQAGDTQKYLNAADGKWEKVNQLRIDTLSILHP